MRIGEGAQGAEPGLTPAGTGVGYARLAAAVGLAALLIRLGPLLTRGVVKGSFGYDESVYFFATQQLIHHQLPYRDFTLVHPPGLLILLSPFAFLAETTSDATGLLAARVAIMICGAMCAVLIVLLLRRFGAVAAMTGGVLYATWSATVSAEWMIYMEPLLGAALLTALWWLRSSGWSHCLAAGAVLGAAMTIKVWAAVPLVVVMFMVLARYGWRRACGFIGAAVVLVAAIMVPFAVSAGPGDIWADVVTFQSGRAPGDVGLGERIAYFTGGIIAPTRLPTPAWLLLGLIAVGAIVVPLVLAIRGPRRRPSSWPETAWWSLLVLVQLGALMAAPSFYDHYTNFAAPALCLLAGVAAGHVFDHRAISARVKTVIAVFAIVVAAVFLAGSVKLVGAGMPKPAEVGSAVAGKRCVWAATPAVLIDADIAGEQARRECPTFVDRYAVLTSEIQAPDSDLVGAAAKATHFQRMIADQLAGSDAVLATTDDLELLAGPSAEVLQRDFEQVGLVGRYQYWVRIGRT